MTISLDGENRRRCRTVAGKAFREVERLERMLTLFDPESELCRLNRYAGERPVRTDHELVELIAESLRCSRRTRGAFDVTVNPLMRLWGFRGKGTRPSREEIDRTLENVGYEKVLFDPVRSAITFLRKGIEIDLGGIGKGYAVDRAVRLLKSSGIESALVSFGSVAFALGSPPGKPEWAVAVLDPHDPSLPIGTLRLRDRAIATSGDYHQYLRFGSRKIPHVIDPRSGYPAVEIKGSTVVHTSAAVADAFSTGVMVLGKQEGLSLLSVEPEIEGLLAVKGGGESREYQVSTGWNALLDGSAGRGMTRRRFVRAALLALGSLVVMGRPMTASIESRTKEVIHDLFPGAVSIRRNEIRLDGEQMRTAQEETGRRFRNDTYVFYEIIGEEQPLGYAVILDVRGRERPITFLVAVDPGGAVAGVEVLAYREAVGGEIRSRRFLDQFRQKTLGSRLQPGVDVQAISGATISSRATGYAVRKGLALILAVYSPGGGGLGK